MIDDFQPGPFTATDSEAYADPSASSGGSPPLHDHHRKHLMAAGYLPETIERGGYWSCDDEQARELLGISATEYRGHDFSGLVFPFPGTDYVKVRPDTPRLSAKGKVIKYEAPRGRSAEVFIPTSAADTSRDASKMLVLCEGEKKAEVLAQYGIAAVAIPGVWNSHDAEEKRDTGDWVLHQTLLRLPLQDREVGICFDHPDMDGGNISVMFAAKLLAEMLEEVGAKPHLTYVPAAGTEKVGADDYLVSIATEHRRFCATQMLLGAVPVEPRAWMKILSEEKDDGATITSQTIRRILIWSRVWWSAEAKTWKRFVNDVSKAKLVRPSVFDAELSKTPEVGRVFEPRTWVRTWLEDRGLTYSGADSAWKLGSTVWPIDRIQDAMSIDSFNAHTGIPDKVMLAALAELMAGAKSRVVAEVRDRIRYRPEDEFLHRGLAERAVALLTGGNGDDIDLAVFRHWLWLVKRKLWGKPVTDHVMMILDGRQRSGKSTAINMLLEPVRDVTAMPEGFSYLADERASFRLAEAFIHFIDEMEKASRTDVEAIKNKITSQRIEYRKLGTNSRIVAPNNAVFIGATNRPLDEQIHDPTGMRRFWVMKTPARMDWPVLNAFPWLRLWQSIDENGPSPIDGKWDQVSARQEQWRAKDSVEEFLATRCKRTEATVTSARVVYNAYSEWMRLQGRGSYMVSETRFGRRMDELDPDLKKRSNGIKYKLVLSDDNAVRVHDLLKDAAE